jgi:protein-tyrosine phosphatase
MSTHRSSFRLPEPGAVPPRDPLLLWRYVAAQWRRAFGLNVTQINELLYVGGEFRASQWPQLHAHGIRAVLSLQAERVDAFEGPAPDSTLRVAVEDFHPPTIDQLHHAVAFIQAAHAQELPVFIHCHAGVGRAPLTASAYLMTRGLSAHESLTYIKRARPIVRLNARQMRRLHEWQQHLHAQRNDDSS